MIIQKISTDAQTGCRLSPQSGVFLTRNGWILGPYSGLKQLAEDLRADAELRGRFSAAGGVRVGRRRSDLVPGPQRGPGSFRAAISGQSPKPVTPQLATEIGKRPGGSNTQRFTEQFDEVQAFYAGRTLEAHHIVEKSILGRLRVNYGDLADVVAPCILVVAELHQQFFSAELAGARALFAQPHTPREEVELLEGLYTASHTKLGAGLYTADALFADLLRIAETIINEVATRRGVQPGSLK